MALLEVRNLSIVIKNHKMNLEAVRGINFDIEEGEIAALAGESGAGKTMTALSIPRLLPAAAGIGSGSITFNSVLLNSCTENDLRAIRGKDIAMIFQEPRQSLNPLLRAGRQISEALELHNEKNRKISRQAALDMLCSMGFSDPTGIYRSFPHQLSLGMCQRVMIAIASMCRPKLLIADEPVNSLDAANRGQVLELLKRMNSENKTAILFITHDLSGIHNFCDRIMIMHRGKIAEQGPAEKILTTPAHPYTQKLISAMHLKINHGAENV